MIILGRARKYVTSNNHANWKEGAKEGRDQHCSLNPPHKKNDGETGKHTPKTEQSGMTGGGAQGALF